MSEKYRDRGIKNGPAKELPAGVEEHLKQKIAHKVYRVLKIHGFGRVDVRLTPQGDVFVIEANPNRLWPRTRISRRPVSAAVWHTTRSSPKS